MTGKWLSVAAVLDLHCWPVTEFDQPKWSWSWTLAENTWWSHDNIWSARVPLAGLREILRDSTPIIIVVTSSRSPHVFSSPRWASSLKLSYVRHRITFAEKGKRKHQRCRRTYLSSSSFSNAHTHLWSKWSPGQRTPAHHGCGHGHATL